MTIALDTAGGLFTRLGHIGGGINDVNAIRGGTATASVLEAGRMTTRFVQLNTDYDAAPVDNNVLDGVYSSLAGFQSAQGSFLSALKKLAENTVIEMANDDAPLSSKTVLAALTTLISQMVTNSEFVEASVPAAGAQTSVGTPNGTPIVVVSVKNPNGTNCDYCFAETLTFKCTADSQGGGTLRGEPLQVTSKAAIADSLAFDWPGGSAITQQLIACDAQLDAQTSGNKLTNSDFETFTVANTPDKWPVIAGTVGTTIFSLGSGYTGANALRFTGTAGLLLTGVYQAFNDSTLGTAGTVKPLTQYAYSFWHKVSSTPAAGVLEVSLSDGSSTINDAAGTANLATHSLTGVSTTWIKASGVFRTPAVLPAIVQFRIRLSTAITDTKSVDIDDVGFAEMTKLYDGGPYAKVFSGATKLITGDAYTIAITNTIGLFQKLFERLFGMRALGLQLPSHASQTIDDTLIV